MAVGRRARAPGFRWLANRYLRATAVFDQRLPAGAGLLSLQGIVRRGYALGGFVVSFAVSFSYVRRGSACITQHG
jgi:hypothetical protein